LNFRGLKIALIDLDELVSENDPNPSPIFTFTFNEKAEIANSFLVGD